MFIRHYDKPQREVAESPFTEVLKKTSGSGTCGHVLVSFNPVSIDNPVSITVGFNDLEGLFQSK